jgi:D-3-phosphoglycerate dehydrogenase
VVMTSSLAELLAGSDVLSVHCPLTPGTRHLVDAAALALLPQGAFVINTARGGIVDEAALAAALDSGHLGGAALDVFEGEPPSADHPLRDHPKVIATPHISGVTQASLVNMGVMAAECIAWALTGAAVPEARIVKG